MTNEPFTEETTGQIDPQNPFDNALENSAYRTDYRRFLPQILLPGFQIPLFPERDERRNIRRQMNTAGAGMLLGTLIAQLLFPLAVLLLLLCMDGTTASYFNGDQSGAVRTIMNSGIYMALHCLILAGSNVLVALLGCRRIRQPLGGLFRTTDFSGWKAFQYICIGIGLQYVAVLIYAVLKYVGQGLGMEFPEVSFDYFQTGQSTMLVLLYTCILAPITEELLFRGFLLKSLSVVSTRFGVIVTALLFGLMHGNVQQGILGVLVGLVVIQLFPANILGLFEASPDMLAIGVPALRIISLCFVFAGFSIICSSTFQALGNGLLSMMISIVRQLLILLPAAFFLSLSGSVTAVWWAFPIAELASLALCVIFLRRIYRRVILPLE